MSLAACEGVKAKRLIGSLRALWRSSKMKGHNQRVTHLKSFLRESPERQRPAPVVPVPDPPAAVSDHEVSDEGPADDGGSSAESSPASPNREAVVEVGANVESERDAADSDSSSLKAPTLRLDDCRDDDDAEELGTESDSSESSDVDGEPCSPVYKDAFEAGDSQGEMWDMYADWCFDSLLRHDDVVYEQLASAECFHAWCREQKAQADWGRCVACMGMLCK
eukprot:s17_g13.t1